MSSGQGEGNVAAEQGEANIAAEQGEANIAAGPGTLILTQSEQEEGNVAAVHGTLILIPSEREEGNIAAGPAAAVSTATLILHPLMARAVFRGARWASNAPVRHLSRFKAVFNRGRVERDAQNGTARWSLILAAVEAWFDQRPEEVGLFVLQRGLLDLRRKRIYSVDIVCELGG